jgi:hypothetical protein
MSSSEALTVSESTIDPGAVRPAKRPPCAYKTGTGKPCRYTAVSGKVFCKRHVPRSTQDPEALQEELLAEDLSSSWKVANVMAKLFKARVQGRISSKDAAILCYIAQTFLHALRVGVMETKLQIATILMKAESDELDKLRQDFVDDVPHEICP